MCKLTNDQKWELWTKFAKEKIPGGRFGHIERRIHIPFIKEDKPLIFHSRVRALLVVAILWGVPMGVFALFDDIFQKDVLIQILLLIFASLMFGFLMTVGMERRRRKLNVTTWESFGEAEEL